MAISRIRALQEIEDLRAPSLSITRSIEATVHDTFTAWTKPEFTRLWWAPTGCTPFVVLQDAQVGGAWRIGLNRAHGAPEIWQAGKYLELSEPKRLVMTFAWEQLGSRSEETLLTVNFARQGDRTTIHLHQGIFESTQSRDAHFLAWSEALDQLQTCLRDRRLPVQSVSSAAHYVR